MLALIAELKIVQGRAKPNPAWAIHAEHGKHKTLFPCDVPKDPGAIAWPVIENGPDS